MNKCKFCGDQSGKYDLCYLCYLDYEEGVIDKCKCGNFKSIEYDVCRECYKKTGRKERNVKININDSAIKGRIAEAIVEEMFISMGYEIFRFGMENTVPGFGSRTHPLKGKIAKEIRNMPDFVVVKDGTAWYIEVKYRTNGEFDFQKFEREKGPYNYSNAYFILVTPKHIKIQKVEHLRKGEPFIFLNDCKDFETNKAIIKQYIDFCKKFFGNC